MGTGLGRGVSKASACALCLLVIGAAGRVAAQTPAPPPPPAPGFSFFGVRFGMTKAEVDQKWLPLSEGAYAVSTPAIKQVRPVFDHEGRLYQFSFSVELDFPDIPPTIVNAAFQEALDDRVKKDPALTMNMAVGRDSSQVTIIHNKYRDGYVRHLQEKIAGFFKQ